jgi:DNA-binding transcriptional ArsR family regulator
MQNKEQTEVLLVLHDINDRLQELLEIIKFQHREAIEAQQRKILSSPLRRKIRDLCDGKKSVGEIADELNRSIQQVSNNIALLQNARLIREVRAGKEKRYKKNRLIKWTQTN